MKDSLIQLAENGWLFVLDTCERNVFKALYKRLKALNSQSALLPNKEWSKLAGLSIGSLIKYRNKLVSYGLIVQIKEGGTYVGDANAWGIPLVLPRADIGDWIDLIQKLDTIDDNIYKYINSVQNSDQIEKPYLKDREDKILQLKRNIRRNPIFSKDKDKAEADIMLLLKNNYNIDVLLEISEFLLNSTYNKDVENPYGFLVDCIKNKDKYFRSQIQTKQNIDLIKAQKVLEDEIKFNFAVNLNDDLEYEENSMLEDCF